MPQDRDASQRLSTMASMSDAGDPIREHRQRTGWTITELAHRADIDPGRLGGIEDGSASRRSTSAGHWSVLSQAAAHRNLASWSTAIPIGVFQVSTPRLTKIERS